MRGTTLNSLVQMLRRELRVAESPALGKNTREMHEHFLRSTQERLHREYKWPHMKVYRDVVMAAGERYYAFPDGISLEDAVKGFSIYTTNFTPLDFGIGPDQYNQFNSDIGQRNDPVLRWDLYRDPTDNGDMFEVWPIPASASVSVRFNGIKSLGPLIADADVCDLDDLLIVYFAAADLATDKDKQGKLAKAMSHQLALKRRLSKSRVIDMVGAVAPRRREIVVTHVDAVS